MASLVSNYLPISRAGFSCSAFSFGGNDMATKDHIRIVEDKEKGIDKAFQFFAYDFPIVFLERTLAYHENPVPLYYVTSIDLLPLRRHYQIWMRRVVDKLTKNTRYHSLSVWNQAVCSALDLADHAEHAPPYTNYDAPQFDYLA